MSAQDFSPNTGWRPTWYEFYMTIKPYLPGLLYRLNEIENMRVLSALFKNQYGVEVWDPTLAVQNLTWLFDIEKELHDENHLS